MNLNQIFPPSFQPKEVTLPYETYEALVKAAQAAPDFIRQIKEDGAVLMVSTQQIGSRSGMIYALVPRDRFEQEQRNFRAADMDQTSVFNQFTK